VPRLLQTYPGLNVLAISMLAERGLIRAVMEAGASGYLLKDDEDNIEDLGNVLLSVAEGDIHLSERAEMILKRQTGPDAEPLSQRQLEALSLALAYPHDTTGDIGQRMSIANSTARNLLSNAYLKLGVRTRAAALIKARELGLITPDPPTHPH
jgi:DNA-binding NarL/FixJ family response regulator